MERRLASLTTTLAELNVLYGLYHEAATEPKPDGIRVAKTWFAYTEYCRKYKLERGLPIDQQIQQVGRDTL